MSQFLLSIHSVEGEKRPRPNQVEARQWYADVRALNDDLKSSGAWVFGGRLHEPSAARVVRGNKGKLRVTDGPFVEAKEQIGGFYIIEAPDLDKALEWAARTSDCMRAPIEVRPFARDSME
jgi:hypothetical protein